MFLRCTAFIPQLPPDCTQKMLPEQIFRDIDKHPGQKAPEVTSGLCDVVCLTFLQRIGIWISVIYSERSLWTNWSTMFCATSQSATLHSGAAALIREKLSPMVS